ncbi:MAG: hypothetical protein Q7T57_06045, partial [Dehalococcoidales bacterium]|nr:hypothetical protein [Dehalococcoidales bacterium]
PQPQPQPHVDDDGVAPMDIDTPPQAAATEPARRSRTKGAKAAAATAIPTVKFESAAIPVGTRVIKKIVMSKKKQQRSRSPAKPTAAASTARAKRSHR